MFFSIIKNDRVVGAVLDFKVGLNVYFGMDLFIFVDKVVDSYRCIQKNKFPISVRNPLIDHFVMHIHYYDS